MSARLASPWRAAEPQPVATAAVAAALFVVAWGIFHFGFYARGQLPDTPIYQRYADAIKDGQVPYRDFAVEYPPGALPSFVLPALAAKRGDETRYGHAFDGLMAACGAAAAAAVGFALVRLRASPTRLRLALALVGFAPLLLGSVLRSHFDLWPTAVTAAALAAIVSGRRRWGAALLGLAAAVKFYPLALAPLFLTYVWRQLGRREAAACAAWLFGVGAAVVIPFLAIAPGGVWNSVVGQITRPLQIESLGSATLLAAHQIAGVGLTMSSSHGSQNLAGPAPDAVTAVQSALEIAALLALWLAFAAGSADRDRFLRFAAAVVVAFVALGKVLSPQYLIWLVPFIAFVRGRRGLVGGLLLAVAMLLTQLWFPYRYWKLALAFDAEASWLVLVRDLLLVALLVTLGWPRRWVRAEARTRGSSLRHVPV